MGDDFIGLLTSEVGSLQPSDFRLETYSSILKTHSQLFPVISVICSEIRSSTQRPRSPQREPPEALRSLRALRSNVVICYGVSPDRDDSVVDPEDCDSASLEGTPPTAVDDGE